MKLKKRIVLTKYKQQQVDDVLFALSMIVLVAILIIV